MMKKRIAMLAVLLFVASMFVSVSEAKVVSDSNASMSSSETTQAVDCGETCAKTKKSCSKSAEKKKECSKSAEKKEGCSKSKSSCSK